jgi:superfamily II DNA or RNA helicase
MHAKAYLFKRQSGFTTAYIGSSNLSNPALNGGLEWNVKVTEQESFDIVKKFIVSFESYWNDPTFETFDPSDENCCRKLQDELSRPLFEKNNPRHLQIEIRPYAYQQEILDKLMAERQVYGHNKNLVVAATGVGKTVIAAFDYKRFRQDNPRARLLFVAHRKEILEQSIQTFQEILNDFNFGELYVDGRKPTDIAHLFISIQSFNSAKLSQWTTDDYYDYICVDEFHHAAANSYQELLAYYKPKILLGLTATPDRMDGKDILKYFDGRTASKMLLGEAIDRNLLSTFQYFGVTDEVDYRKLKWTRGKYDTSELEKIYTADIKRCSLVLESVRKYVADMDEVKGLGFCVSVAHADYMAMYFNSHGVPSISLSAKSMDDIRDDAKQDLVSGKIKFIFVVDLYNEGVDIPQVNTILFLRPTESATVFLQQFGRGLRICPGKDCLTVLDFIGQANKKYNYAMKFESMVGKGRKSLEKQIEDGFSNLPRGCYIELEKYAKSYILENLKQTDNSKKVLIEHVRTFEADTGLPLTLENFLTEYDLSLYDFYQNGGGRSLYRLKKWAGLIPGSKDVDDKIYSMLTGLFHINSVRLLDYWIRYIKGDHSIRSTAELLMRNMLYYTFYKKHPKKMGFSSIDAGIEAVLHEPFVKSEVLEILDYNRRHVGFVAGANEYSFICPLDLHCQYNTNQIMAAFGLFSETESPEFREGVKYFDNWKTDIFLINLKKSLKDFSPSTMYEDYAINAHLFHWESQSQDREASSKIQRYIHHKETGNNVSLFVREYKYVGSYTYTAPYTFLGNADYVSHEGERPVSFIWKLHNAIPAELLPKANKSIAL